MSAAKIHPHIDIANCYMRDTRRIVFSRYKDKKWVNSYSVHPCWLPDKQYFLCHPAHTEKCLAWLNGADIEEYSIESDWQEVIYRREWYENHPFMNLGTVARILDKPRIVDRWMAVDPSGIRTGSSLYRSEDELRKCVGSDILETHTVIKVQVEI